MNYFEIKQKINLFLHEIQWQHDTPILETMIKAHLERAFILKEQGINITNANMLLVNFSKYIKKTNLEYLARKALFTIARSQKHPSRNLNETVLLSPSIFSRFPELLPKISLRANIATFITAFNFRVIRREKNNAVIKIHNTIYPPSIIKLLECIIDEINKKLLDNNYVLQIPSTSLYSTENKLEKIVNSLCLRMENLHITQYISAFSNRYDDILISHACRILQIPSKEIAHGINNFTLESGQTLVPNTFDYMLVWRDQAKEDIISYGGSPDRIQVIGYPKYSNNDITTLKSLYPVEKKITFFSQTIFYTIGSPFEAITREHQQMERANRQKLFDILEQFGKKNNYSVNIRYHPSESYKPLFSRTNEIDDIKRNTNIKISENSFEYDIFSSEIAIGVNSSCLYEASIIGNRAIQIDWPGYKQGFHKNVPTINLDELLTYLEKVCKEPMPSPQTNSFINIEKMLNFKKTIF